MNNNNKFSAVSISDLDGVISPNSIIGNPIKFGGNAMVLPVIKSTILHLGGGGEYGEIKVFSGNKTHPFAGGSGAILNTTPCGFLVYNNNDFAFIKVPEDVGEKLLDKSIEIIKKAVDNEE